MERIVPDNWDPKEAGDRVLANLVSVSKPSVKYAHSADFFVREGKAYVVYMANDIEPVERVNMPFIYSALSIVDMASGRVEQTVTFAASEKAYDNEALPVGSCYCPRIIRKDDRTLRCFFDSEDPQKRESQTWYLDFDLVRGGFDWNIHRAEIETSAGVFPMQPKYFHQQAVAAGFTGPHRNHELHRVDVFKRFDGRWYTVVNNFLSGLNSWAELNAEMTRFSVLGNFFLPLEAKLTEAAVNRLPDGTWLAICRQENRDQNYMFAESRDGRLWSPAEYRPVVTNGASSKPTFDRFGDVYYLGWNEATRINGAIRSVFNIEVSRDGRHWERKYRFETDKSFQYPTFHDVGGVIYVAVTQGDTAKNRKERIMFGRLE